MPLRIPFFLRSGTAAAENTYKRVTLDSLKRTRPLSLYRTRRLPTGHGNRGSIPSVLRYDRYRGGSTRYATARMSFALSSSRQRTSLRSRSTRPHVFWLASLSGLGDVPPQAPPLPRFARLPTVRPKLSRINQTPHITCTSLRFVRALGTPGV